MRDRAFWEDLTKITLFSGTTILTAGISALFSVLITKNPLIMIIIFFLAIFLLNNAVWMIAWKRQYEKAES
ncbi:MAG: hypothetical protein ACXADY_16830 [Candidatus Hodarchaeales archaeon]|jgi:hypothetical protein